MSTVATKPTLTPQHPRWEDFVLALEDTLEAAGVCDHSHRISSHWLEDHGFDVTETLAHFEQHGGFCDCEVYVNLGLA